MAWLYIRNKNLFETGVTTASGEAGSTIAAAAAIFIVIVSDARLGNSSAASSCNPAKKFKTTGSDWVHNDIRTC